MPPKKGKKGKKSGGKKGKKGGKKSKDADVPEGAAAENVDAFVDKEELLREELFRVYQAIDATKLEIESLKKENEWLHEEAQRIRLESHEYMSYVEKKVDKRQRTIVTLSDNNQHEIDKLYKIKQEMLEVYEVQKAKLRDSLLKKENLLAKARKELEELSDFQQLRQEQTDKIKLLERQLRDLRVEQADQMQKIKAEFIKEKQEFQENSEQQVQELTKAAYQEAQSSIIRHTNGIKQENHKLRKELLFLIQQTKALQKRKKKLEEQHSELLREQDFAKDMAQLRNSRQYKMLKTFAKDKGLEHLFEGSTARTDTTATEPTERLNYEINEEEAL